MSTFIGQLVGSRSSSFIVWRYVVPPVRRMMRSSRRPCASTGRERRGQEALAEAEAHAKAVEQAKAEAKR
jgi:F-type H+-transporting ATPase subunit delta